MCICFQGNTVLHYAVSHANYDITRALLDTGVVNVNTQNKAGYTPVMLVAICEIKNADEKTTISHLLSKADINIRATQVCINISVYIRVICSLCTIQSYLLSVYNSELSALCVSGGQPLCSHA